MNDDLFHKNCIFENPEYKPLEELKLMVQINGVTKIIPALDKYWIEKKYFLNYETPNLIDLNGKNIIGAKEQWFELTNFIFDDLMWLLHLPFYKFWSNIIYNPSIIDSIIIFLQEAPTVYTLENFLNSYDVKEHFDRIRQNILIIFARLVTNKESPTEYISLIEHSYLLYNKYIFTIPILMDLCQQYGRDNKKIIEKIVCSVFTLQPVYKEDLRKAVIFITQVLRKIERRFEDCPMNQKGKAVPLSERGGANIEITLLSLQDMILYLLDTVSNISIFLDIYTPSVDIFKAELFVTKIISVYGNTIPEMYKKLNDLVFKEETLPKYIELKHRLDVTRIEILNIYRLIIYKKIKDIVETRNTVSASEIGEIVEDFLFNLMNILTEKEFVIDYHKIYPVTDDFQILIDLHPDLDTVKCEFIINSIFTFLDQPIPSFYNSSRKLDEPTFGLSFSQNDSIKTKIETTILSSSKLNSKSEVELLVSEIKDILCDLDEEMIQKCLKYYKYNKEAVINAVLENSLPVELKNLDTTFQYIPPDSEEKLNINDTVIGIERLNICDNNEFNIISKDVIDTSRTHEGKNKYKYKNLNELLNDKSHLTETKHTYNKYSIISEYDDEYDDTYDGQDINSNDQDDIVEVNTKPLTMSKVLFKHEINDSVIEENIFKFSLKNQKDHNNFIQDPALLRVKIEEKNLNKQRIKIFNSKVESQKTHDQTKDVLDIKNKKNKYKTSKANHNRRVKSQLKRNYGMVPS